MIYKYFNEKGAFTFLETKAVRYTQFSAFNDPYDGSIFPLGLYTKEQRGRFELDNSYLPEMDPEMLEVASSILGGKTDFFSAKTLDWKNLKRVRERYGAFSLSRTAASTPMWTHYGESHRGVVIGFDEHHSFFRNQGLKLRSVIYSSSHPQVYLTTMTPEDVWLTKSSEWSYEQEVRHIRKLGELPPPRSQDDNGLPIYLVDVPVECIRKIILGRFFDKGLLDRIRSFGKDFPAAIWEQMFLSGGDYGMHPMALEPNAI